MQDNGYELTCTWYEDANEKLESYYTMKQAPRQSYKSMIAGCNIGTPGVLVAPSEWARSICHPYVGLRIGVCG